STQDDLPRRLHAARKGFARKEFWAEVHVLDRIRYKNEKQHRTGGYFKKLLAVKRILRRLQELALDKLIDDLLDIMQPSRTKKSMGRWEYLPQRQYFAYMLVRLMGAYAVLTKMSGLIRTAYLSFQSVASQTYFMAFSLVSMSSLARLHLLGKQMRKDVSDCYDLVWMWMGHVPAPEKYAATLPVSLSAAFDEYGELVGDIPPDSDGTSILPSQVEDEDDADSAPIIPRLDDEMVTISADVSDSFWASSKVVVESGEGGVEEEGVGGEKRKRKRGDDDGTVATMTSVAANMSIGDSKTVAQEHITTTQEVVLPVSNPTEAVTTKKQKKRKAGKSDVNGKVPPSASDTTPSVTVPRNVIAQRVASSVSVRETKPTLGMPKSRTEPTRSTATTTPSSPASHPPATVESKSTPPLVTSKHATKRTAQPPPPSTAAEPRVKKLKVTPSSMGGKVSKGEKVGKGPAKVKPKLKSGGKKSGKSGGGGGNGDEIDDIFGGL
ncbi:hypothetical protein HK104_006299, partial [Borealophlyctis nickersoniae]